jgi:hypothetical protein
MFSVDAPERISTPGHSTSGAEGVGEAAWVTPGVALENRPANRLPNELSDDPMLEPEEQPDNAAATNSRAITRRPLRFRSS